MVPNPRPVGQRIRVDYSRPIAGAPRGPRTSPVADDALRDDARLSGNNPVAADGSVWGRRVAPVTGRKARKSPGWTPRIAGGSHIVAQGV